MKTHIDYNGMVLSIISEGCRVRFDLVQLKACMFRRYAIPKGGLHYNNPEESLFPFWCKDYPDGKSFCENVKRICKREKVDCPPDILADLKSRR